MRLCGGAAAALFVVTLVAAALVITHNDALVSSGVEPSVSDIDVREHHAARHARYARYETGRGSQPGCVLRAARISQTTSVKPGLYPSGQSTHALQVASQRTGVSLHHVLSAGHRREERVASVAAAEEFSPNLWRDLRVRLRT